MTRTVKMDIFGSPEEKMGFEVVTLEDGQLYHYGIYPDRKSAEAAAADYEERFVVEVVD